MVEKEIKNNESNYRYPNTAQIKPAPVKEAPATTESQPPKLDTSLIEMCEHCHCMTHTMDDETCGKCKKPKADGKAENKR